MGVASFDSPPTYAHLGTLSEKLQHELVVVRVRAIQNLLFKLRSGILLLKEIENKPDIDVFVKRVLASVSYCDTEGAAVQILQIIIEVYTRVIRRYIS